MNDTKPDDKPPPPAARGGGKWFWVPDGREALLRDIARHREYSRKYAADARADLKRLRAEETARKQAPGVDEVGGESAK